MRQPILFISSVIICSLGLSVSRTVVAQETPAVPVPHYTVIINNTCHQDISVAIHYRHPEMGWITQGWWEVAGSSEASTGLGSDYHQFYMHGKTAGSRQWPPENSRKNYNRYPVLLEDFLLEEGQASDAALQVPFSLKEISPSSGGLKARFDC